MNMSDSDNQAIQALYSYVLYRQAAKVVATTNTTNGTNTTTNGTNTTTTGTNTTNTTNTTVATLVPTFSLRSGEQGYVADNADYMQSIPVNSRSWVHPLRANFTSAAQEDLT